VLDLRIERLRDLSARLEQAPRSRKRDALLRTIRDRIVTLDTGPYESSLWQADAADLDVLSRLVARARQTNGAR
jgi:hypothetical protein